MNINIKLSDEQLNNLIVFLNRVEYKGLEEVHAIQEILATINNSEKLEDGVELPG